MPFYYIIIIILVIFLICTLLFNLLFNPFVWIVIGGLVLWSWIRRYLYRKQLEDYNKEFEQKVNEKKEYYYGSNQQDTYHRNDSDVIDVDYTVVDERESD